MGYKRRPLGAEQPCNFGRLAFLGVADLKERHAFDLADAVDLAAFEQSEAQGEGSHAGLAGLQNAGYHRLLVFEEAGQGHATTLPIAEFVDKLRTGQPGEEERLLIIFLAWPGMASEEGGRILQIRSLDERVQLAGQARRIVQFQIGERASGNEIGQVVVLGRNRPSQGQQQKQKQRTGEMHTVFHGEPSLGTWGESPRLPCLFLSPRL